MARRARLSRKPIARPFVADRCILVLVAPFALEPCVMDEVPCPFHSEPLHQRDGWSVAAIGSGDDAAELEYIEREIYHRSCSLGRETAVLVCASEGVADFSDSRRRPDNQQRAIADVRSSRFEFGGELKPSTG